MPDKAPSDNDRKRLPLPSTDPCEPRCERFPLCLCGSAIPCQPHSVADTRRFKLTKIHDLPQVDVADELRPITRAGLPKFDAVGLFVQWLAEAVSTLDAEFWIRLTYAKTHGNVVELEVHAVLKEQILKRLWHVGDLNNLLRDANGRGDELKAEIQRTMIELRNKTEGAA